MLVSLVQAMGEMDVNNPDGYGYEELAEHLLKRVEKHMLPPRINKRKMVKQGSVMACPEQLKDNLIMWDFGSVYEWELEE